MYEWSCIRHNVWTEHFHTRLFLDTFIFVHTSHCGSRCRTTCLHESMFMHMSSHVWAFVVSLFCLLLSIVPLFSLSLLFVLSWTSTSMMSRTPSIKPNAFVHNEECCSVAKNYLLTNLSHSWRKFVASSAFFSHALVRGDPSTNEVQICLKKTKIMSRLRKRANQDSPWKTKRANSCWSQIWHPEARTSSRVW